LADWLISHPEPIRFASMHYCLLIHPNFFSPTAILRDYDDDDMNMMMSSCFPFSFSLVMIILSSVGFSYSSTCSGGDDEGDVDQHTHKTTIVKGFDCPYPHHANHQWLHFSLVSKGFGRITRWGDYW
jgi:hypothetical protein